MIEYLKKRILNGLALGYKLNDVPEFLLVKSGLNFIIKKEENEQISKTDRKLKLNVNVVSLRFRCDRRIQMVAGLKSSKIPYKIHHAVHGKSIKPHQITANQFSKQSIKYLSSGSIGAIISHYQLWVYLLDSSSKIHIIFEDDVVIPPNLFQKIQELVQLVPSDFDILYLGSGSKKKLNLRKKLSSNVFMPFYPRKGLYAYIITDEGIRTILEQLFPIKITCGSLDTIVGNLVRKNLLNAFQVSPDICSVDYESPSNIYNFSNKNKKLHITELR